MEAMSSQAGRSQSSTSEENAGGVDRSLEAFGGSVVPVMLMWVLSLSAGIEFIMVAMVSGRVLDFLDDEDLSRFYFLFAVFFCRLALYQSVSRVRSSVACCVVRFSILDRVLF
jgi:hypothetical protein